ncbi:MAG: ribonuclease R [Proteobacteria bacterium]|nr:ribonuclease R [Pseudomonadota bacterium]
MSRKTGKGAGGKGSSSGGQQGRGARQGSGGRGGKSSLPSWMPTAGGKGKSDARASGNRPGKGGAHDPMAHREAERYAEPIASREAILLALSKSEGPQSAQILAQAFDLAAPDRFEILTRRLSAMVRDGQLLRNRSGDYLPARAVDLVRGTVIANPDGFGFLRPDEGGEDLFLPPLEMRKAMHGDKVLACITGLDRRGRPEGQVVEVLERRLNRLTGRFVLESGISYVVPDDRRIQRNVQIPSDARGDARNGQLVVCEITQAADAVRPPIGRIVAVLGDKLTPSLVVEAAIHGHDLPHEFSQDVLDEAANVPQEVTSAMTVARLDLRTLPLVTIDGKDAKDFDDAVWCEAQKGGGFRLIVAIADVSNYVQPGTPLDREALLRATSVYFPGFVVPMLPETLSNGICSLNPKVDRLCFACDMQVDAHGQVTSSSFHEAVMNSHARLTYTQVWNAIGDGIPDDAREDALQRVGSLLPQVQQLHALYKVLAQARQKRGAIEFESSEVRFVLDNTGDVVQAGMLQRNDAHKLIEECMIAANVEAARFLIAHHMPAPFRIHDKPPEAKYADLLEFLKEFNLRMPPWSKVTPGDFTALLKVIRERPDAPLLESVLLRSQSLAVYSPDNIGHFGLALDAYAHFTSPIRRYPDLVVHRAIKHVLRGGSADRGWSTPREMAALTQLCSDRERRADEAEREVDERYRAAWMEKHVGGRFAGTISGVTSFGLFVELTESKVSGLVHVTSLPQDFYHFDPIRKTLTGDRRGLEFRLGDQVEVIVLKASLEDRRIDFKLVDDPASPHSTDSPRPSAPRGKPAKRSKKPY